MDSLTPTRHIVLWGPPGVGKSTVSRELALHLNIGRTDSDEQLAQTHGVSVQELFLREREWGFRRLEAQVIRELLSAPTPQVISLGGGALLDAQLRREVLEKCWLIVLSAPDQVLYERIMHAPQSRPLLQGADASRVTALMAQRKNAYCECHAMVDAQETTEMVVQRVLSAWRELERDQPVCVGLGERTYGVRFCSLSVVQEQLKRLTPTPSKVLVVTDQNVLRAPGVRSLIDSVAPVATVVLEGLGDQDKTLANLSRVWTAALEGGLDRRSVLLAVGGGVVSDLTGFAAATLLRGVRYATVATTVLSICDASVGGKTAIDFGPGKNLIGAFHQPSFVCCAVETLETLPVRDRVAGLAEALKVSLVVDRALFDLISEKSDLLRAGELNAIASIVPAAVQAKTRVVLADERETGARMCLNFGHTLGHALEQQWNYEVSHGECVALGMRAALKVGELIGCTSHESVSVPVGRLMDALGLPSKLLRDVTEESLLQSLVHDKKSERSQEQISLQFVALSAIGRYEFKRLTPGQVLSGLTAFG